MPVIAVTGATGFVGRSIIRRLTAAHPQTRLRLLVRNPAARKLPAALDSPDIEIIAGDLWQPGALDALVRSCNSVVHVAAAIAGNTAAEFDRANVLGTRILADAIGRRAPDAHLIHISSLAARHPELSWYAASKRHAEEVVQSRLDRVSIMRPPAIYGPDDPALAGFWRWLARGWLIRLGPRDACFSLLHVEDLARAVVVALEHGPVKATLEPAGAQPCGGWQWHHIAQAARNVRAGPVRTLAVPAALLSCAALTAPLVGRMLGRPAILNPGKVRELRHLDWVCDNLSLGPLPGWQPEIELEQALPGLPGWSKT